ncbi:MAG: protein-export chaperone SecB [Alphaproteobacteria bacterium]|nr:protein-export chaperone SecB [Alphaproteobacteria bacterium]
MTDTSGPATATDRPAIGIVAQYLKDLSFESPNAPQSLSAGQASPQIEVNLDVQAKPVGGSRFEVALRITATAKREESAVFVAEVVHAGVFDVGGLAKEQWQAACLMECPRFIFPYARHILANLTRDGGFPPLMLDPIDFAGMYRQQQGAPGAPAPATVA